MKRTTPSISSALLLAATLLACGGTQAPAASASAGPSAAARARLGTARTPTATTSRASALSGLRSRASCAAIDMAVAMGDKVSPADKKRCAGAARPAAPSAPRAMEPTAAQVRQLEPTPERPRHTSKPSWVDRPPRAAGMLYGVGQGGDVKEAFADAVNVISAQMKVSISSELVDEESQSTSSEKGTTYRESISSTTRMLIRSALEDVSLEDQWVSGEKTYILAAFDLAALRAKEQAIVDAVLGSLAEASERLLGRLETDGVIDQADVVNVVDVMVEALAMGRSKIGRKVKGQWTKEYRALRRSVQSLLSCVEVTGPGGAPLASGLAAGTHGLQVTCRGKPVIHARMAIDVDAGLAKVPTALQTDAKGQASLTVSSIYGRGLVGFALRHDLSAIEHSELLGEVETTANGKWTMAASAPARVTLKVAGVQGAAKGRIAKGMGAWLSQKFGADVVRSGGQLDALVRMNIETSIAVSGKYTQPLRWQLTVQSREGKVFDRSGKAGALSDSKQQALEDAITSMFQRINRW